MPANRSERLGLAEPVIRESRRLLAPEADSNPRVNARRSGRSQCGVRVKERRAGKALRRGKSLRLARTDFHDDTGRLGLTALLRPNVAAESPVDSWLQPVAARPSPLDALSRDNRWPVVSD